MAVRQSTSVTYQPRAPQVFSEQAAKWAFVSGDFAGEARIVSILLGVDILGLENARDTFRKSDSG